MTPDAVAPVRVGVVGLGYFAQLHLAAWRAIDGATLVGASDVEPARVAAASAAFGVPGHATLEALLDAASPDVVDLVVPPPAHAALIRGALGRTRVIVCQKPFCTSLAEAEAVTAEAERAGTTLLVHENFRFQPWYRTLKRWLDGGGMGAIWQARFELRPGDGRGPRAYLDRQPSFRTMPELLVHETGVHFLDLFRWLFGDVVSVYADLDRLNPAVAGEDAGLVVLGHANGVRSVFDGNRLADRVADEPRLTMGELLLEGETGTLRLGTDGRLRLRRFGARDETIVPLERAFDPGVFGGGCVEALNRHVVAALAGRGAFENAARDYLPVIALRDAAYRSAATGARVRVGPGR